MSQIGKFEEEVLGIRIAFGGDGGGGDGGGGGDDGSGYDDGSADDGSDDGSDDVGVQAAATCPCSVTSPTGNSFSVQGGSMTGNATNGFSINGEATVTVSDPAGNQTTTDMPQGGSVTQNSDGSFTATPNVCC